MMQSSRLIILEACIAAGKSTLGRSIAKYYDNKGIKAKYLPEFSYQEFLDYYLENMKEQAYNFQIHMIRERISLFNKAIRKLKSGKYKIVIIDRGWMGDLCFAKMLYDNGFITKREYKIYAGMATISKPKKIPAGVSVDVIYLKSTPTILMERIKRRGIMSEIKKYDIDYITKVCDVHDIICSDDPHSLNKLDEVTKGILTYYGQYSKVKILNYDQDLSPEINDANCLSDTAIESILGQL